MKHLKLNICIYANISFKICKKNHLNLLVVIVVIENLNQNIKKSIISNSSNDFNQNITKEF